MIELVQLGVGIIALLFIFGMIETLAAINKE